MSKRNRDKLIKSYSKYRTQNNSKSSVLGFFRAIMPEIIFRTTRLEGESVSRKAISSIFK